MLRDTVKLSFKEFHQSLLPPMVWITFTPYHHKINLLIFSLWLAFVLSMWISCSFCTFKKLAHLCFSYWFVICLEYYLGKYNLYILYLFYPSFLLSFCYYIFPCKEVLNFQTFFLLWFLGLRFSFLIYPHQIFKKCIFCSIIITVLKYFCVWYEIIIYFSLSGWRKTIY